MRISNPRFFVGDQPLATRKYVIDAINSTGSSLSGNLNDTTNILSGYIYNLRTDVEKWLTGNRPLSGSFGVWGKHNTEGINGGYAFLDPNTGKIDLSLMPPLSITKVIPATQTEVALAFQQENLNFQSSAVNKDGKYGAVEAFLRQKDNEGKPLKAVEVGDVIVVTYDKDTDQDKINNDLVGPYIVTSPNYDPNTGILDNNVEVLKLSYPDSPVQTVNGLNAVDGDIQISLEDLYRVKQPSPFAEQTELIGKELANTLFRIVPFQYDEIDNSRLKIYEVDKESGEKIAIEYAKYEDVTNLSAAVFNEIDTVNNDLIKKITELSDDVYEKIAEGNTELANLANKIGTAADEKPAESYDEIIINNSILSQLRRIYGDLTNIYGDLTSISGTMINISDNVDTISGGFTTLKVRLKDDAVAGLQWFETDWKNVKRRNI